MATTSSLSSTTSTATTTQAANSSNATIANNFASFLNLLTTQLKNQSPLDPLNTNEFTQQLVQFASVEQQMKSNDSLSSLLSATKSASIMNTAGLVGSTVTADGSTSKLTNGSAEWRLQAARAVTGATITIKDANGSVVYTEKKNLTAGDQAFTWSGKTSTGASATDGEYTVNITALDSSGQTVSVKTEVQGAVEKVDFTGTEPTVSLGKISIPLSKVKTVQRSA